VTDDGDHSQYLATANSCVDDTVEAFLIRGVLPGARATCPGRPIPPPEDHGDPRTTGLMTGNRLLDTLYGALGLLPSPARREGRQSDCRAIRLSTP
ncbi:MAG TPA: alpha/beta hydrolase, partial [Acidimicrobiia bacterium]